MFEHMPEKKFTLQISIAVVVLAAIPSGLYLLKNKNPFSNEVVIKEIDLIKAGKREIVLTDRDFADYNGVITTSKPNSEEPVRKLADNSEIYVMDDGFGNKTVTRFFPGHPRLKKVILRNGADGRMQIFVYGQNGAVENLSEKLVEQALNSRADELANLANIYETGDAREKRREDFARRRADKLNPLPSEAFPLENPTAEFPEMPFENNPPSEKPKSADTNKAPSDPSDKSPEFENR